jgi:shikimate dehydrogenase
MITGKGKVAAVLGWPVTHSLSPVLHGHWLDELKIDGALVPLSAAPENFAAIINGIRRAGFTGVNVTVPNKESAFALAHENDAAAIAAGATNLLVFKDGRILGRNTDTYGLYASLEEVTGKVNGATVILLGAGGASRGAVLALDQLGAGTIHLLNRDAKRAATLAAALGKQVKANIIPGGLDGWAAAAKDAVLVVNATAAGMSGNPPLAIDLGLLPKNAVISDMVYSPLETHLLKDAAARGLKTIDGLGMLMHQAVPSFEAFFGVKPKVTPELRAALIAALKARG